MRASHQPLRSRLLLLVLALCACLKPAWSAPRAPESGLSACCVEPEPGGCCPSDEAEESGPSIVPRCCGVEPVEGEASLPRPATGAALAHVRERALGDVAREPRPAEPWSVRLASPRAAPELPGLSPPGAASAGARAWHWWTDREPRAALALLGVARL